LRRHGFTSLLDRPALARYCAHARRVFQAEFACFSLAPTTKKFESALMGEVSTDGTVPTCKTNSYCEGLINHEESFVIKNVDYDARIQTRPHLQEQADKNPHKMKFYASAPLFLSLPSGEKEDTLVSVGRLCLISAAPRPNWNDDDTKLLNEISLMTTESLEREMQTVRSKRVSLMQRATGECDHLPSIPSIPSITSITSASHLISPHLIIIYSSFPIL